MGSGAIIEAMVIDMNEAQVKTLQQVRAVLEGTAAMEMRAVRDPSDSYGWVAAVLKRFNYRQLGRPERGLVLRYLARFSGYSRAQITRLVKRWCARSPLIKRYSAPKNAFAKRFGASDVALLVEVDQAFDTLSGAATRCILKRAFSQFNDPRFAQLSTISVAHLYNLRHRPDYLSKRVLKRATRAVTAPTIGVRKAPAVDGRPGFIRIDSVHQGDHDGAKGVYHINAVDCLTQWQVVASVQAISEAYLLPVIAEMLNQFPFKLHGFHADNGSEYVNHEVAKLLNKLHIEFTRSRPRHSNDNGLAETKNGAVVRGQFGYAHIPQRFAATLNQFCAEHLNTFINFHRPCLFSSEWPDPKKPGRIQKKYHPNDVMTPFDKFCSLPDPAQFLRADVTLAQLHVAATKCTDLQAAQALRSERAAVFRRFFAA